MKPAAETLSDQPLSIIFSAAILAPEQPAKPCANDRRDEPIAVLVALDHPHCFFFPRKAMRRDEMLRADCHFLAGSRLNVAKPVRVGTETIHHDNLGALLPVLDDFEDGLTPEAGAAANMTQQ